MRYLVGCAGHPNFGDELIAEAWLRWFGTNHAEERVWLDSHTPGTASVLLSGAHPRAHFTDTIWRIVDLARGDGRSWSESVDLIHHWVRHGGTPMIDSGVELLRSAESIHFVGGGYLTAHWPHHSLLLEVARAVKETTGTKLYATGQGVYPPDDQLDFTEFDFVSCRDSQSAESLGVSLGVDDAFLALNDRTILSRYSTANHDSSLVVCVQGDMLERSTFDRAISVIQSTIHHSNVRADNIFYVEGIPGTDYAGYASLRDFIPKENFVPFTHFWERGFPVNRSQIWLTTRFHHHLVASFQGARGVAFSISDDYYNTKHRSLSDMGSGWQIYDAWREQPPAPVDLEALPSPRWSSYPSKAKSEEAEILYGISNVLPTWRSRLAPLLRERHR